MYFHGEPDQADHAIDEETTLHMCVYVHGKRIKMPVDFYIYVNLCGCMHR